MKKILLAVLLAPSWLCAASIVPADSEMSRLPAQFQQVLVSPIEPGEAVSTGSWMMNNVGTREFPEAAKFGQAISIYAESTARGKVSAILPGAVPKDAEMIGVWIYRDSTSNVGEVGFEVTDAEGEMHLLKRATDESGWQWIEANLTKDEFRPSYPQGKQGKNGRLDLPLRSAGIYYFAQAPGPCRLGVDAFLAAGPKGAGSGSPVVKMMRGGPSEPDEPLTMGFVVSNAADQPAEFELETVIQHDSQLRDTPPEGGELERKRTKVNVPARGFDFVTVTSDKKYPTGAYFVTAKSPGGAESNHLFVLPPGKLKPGFASRFGINASDDLQIDAIQRLGMGWVRFENLKWPMMSKEPGYYAFDGSKGPVNADRILQAYHDAGLEVLPYLFMTAKYAAPEPEKENFRQQAPKDNALYAEFCRQASARFGASQRPAAELLTADKQSGKGLLKVVELWNEPNLQDPGWGHWIGTTAAYLELLRAGAEAVKKTDPKMLISPAGWAGVDLDYVAELDTYTYADGRHPKDFIDLINVHQYTGASAPEIARVNTNIQRDGKPVEGPLLVERLQRLADWRARAMPGKEIWMTETGFDTGGPRAVSWRDQAAFSPRNQIIMFGSGIDKIFTYRTVGDSPFLYGASGLMASNNRYKPSFFTMATLVRLVDQFTRATLLPPRGDVWSCVFEKDGKKILAAWATRGGATLGLDLGQATVVDAFGYRETRPVGAAEPVGVFPVYFTDIEKSAGVEQREQAAIAEDQKRRSAGDKLASVRAYLFDFGSRDRVGGTEIGRFRRFTPVVTGDIYSEKTGFGFTDDSKTADLDAHWIRDITERDSCRVKAGGRFIFKVEPGQYKVSLRVNPVATRLPATVSVEGGGVFEKLEFTKQELVREFDARLEGEISLVFEADADISWLKAVETAAP